MIVSESPEVIRVSNFLLSCGVGADPTRGTNKNPSQSMRPRHRIKGKQILMWQPHFSSGENPHLLSFLFFLTANNAGRTALSAVLFLLHIEKHPNRVLFSLLIKLISFARFSYTIRTLNIINCKVVANTKVNGECIVIYTNSIGSI